jgi:hypothetical protein
LNTNEEMSLISEKHSFEKRERLSESLTVLSFDCGMLNFAYCLLEGVDDPEREFDIKLWQLFSINSLSASEAVSNLKKELDRRPWMLQVDHVIIEAQVLSNSLMKTISHALQMYFLCKSDVPVHFISPKNKFKVTKVPEPENVTGHAKNKKVAILMAEKLLLKQNNRYALEYFHSHKKCDDLADSLLQGVYFLRLLHQKRMTNNKIIGFLKGQRREVTVIDEQESLKTTKTFKADNAHFRVDAATVGSSSTCYRRESSV